MLVHHIKRSPVFLCKMDYITAVPVQLFPLVLEIPVFDIWQQWCSLHRILIFHQ